VASDDPDNLCEDAGTSPGAHEHASCTDFPSLRWDKAPGAFRYRVIIGLDDQFDNIAMMAETSGLTFTPTEGWRDGSPAQSYYYAVQACTTDGCGAVPATPSSFTKRSPRTSLTATTFGNAGPLKFSWGSYANALAAASGTFATSDAYAYRVQVAKADHPSFDQTVDDVLVDSTTYYPTKNYGDGSYVWRVQAVNASAHKLPWSYSKSFTRDTTPPKVISVSPTSVAVNGKVKVVFSEPVTGLGAGALTLSPAAATTVSNVTSTSALLRPGARYTVRVSSAVKDLAGNVAVATGPAFSVNALADSTSPAVSYAGSWRTLSSSNAVGGSYRLGTSTSTSKAKATVLFTGVGVDVTACLGPANGYVDLFVDGVRKTRVNTYRSFSGCGIKVASLTGLTRGNHTFAFVATGSRSSASRGTSVAFDAVTVKP
jgi:hypothetical protein